MKTKSLNSILNVNHLFKLAWNENSLYFLNVIDFIANGSSMHACFFFFFLNHNF